MTSYEGPDRRASTVKRAIHAARFYYAMARARYELAKLPIEKVVERVARRKASRTSARADDTARAKQLAVAFLHYRNRWASTGLCLRDSLTLIHFLAAHRVYPSWVFAVQTDPFQAHCWVQVGACVLNDTIDHTEGFTSIMTV
jgi:hypothetical protein